MLVQVQSKWLKKNNRKEQDTNFDPRTWLSCGTVEGRLKGADTQQKKTGPF